jgi:hypothetical protein
MVGSSEPSKKQLPCRAGLDEERRRGACRRPASAIVESAAEVLTRRLLRAKLPAQKRALPMAEDNS